MPKQKKIKYPKIWVKADNQNKPTRNILSAKSNNQLIWILADELGYPVLGPTGYTKVGAQDPVYKTQITRGKFYTTRNTTTLVWVKTDGRGNKLKGPQGYIEVSEQDPGNKTQVTKNASMLSKTNAKANINPTSQFVWVKADDQGKKLQGPQGYIEVSEQDPSNKVLITKNSFRISKSRSKLRSNPAAATNTPLQFSSHNELSLQSNPSLSDVLAKQNDYSAINDTDPLQFNSYAEAPFQDAPYEDSTFQYAPLQDNPLLLIDDNFDDITPLSNQSEENNLSPTNSWFNFFTTPDTPDAETTEQTDYLSFTSPDTELTEPTDYLSFASPRMPY